MNKKFVGILLILISFTAFADEDIPAPLGLVWGTSGDVLKNEYSASLDEAEHSRLKFYEINKTPINSAEFNKVYGFVDDKYGLVKVVLVKDISSDAYGSEGLELYKKYKNVLQGKYGKPKSYEYTGREVYKETDEFYQCLKYQGCGARASFFEPKKDTSISVLLRGWKRGEGDMVISYESLLYSKANEEIQKETNKVISDGL
ncbi:MULTISPECIES: hypothetical protein [Hafniaceae]|uniref:Uncharacterized protein n=1 Tax=Obesumbacterium proteus ATCC 12841 TaxID=1354268 RepID=A0AA91EDB2_9GAMM|nr:MULTISPECIES: hypothetical protein [Hafniaceae]AMO83117.1 hypothetical protein DSM2777_19965 [Obesumbacterium proteus]OAT58453.1 hypothetical protein M993_02823 [Obesumbacterium proteus ATCC 12841]